MVMVKDSLKSKSNTVVLIVYHYLFVLFVATTVKKSCQIYDHRYAYSHWAMVMISTLVQI